MRLVLRLVALACLVLGVAYLGLLNELIERTDARTWACGGRE